MKIENKSIIILLLLTLISKSQINTPFIKHLYDNKLLFEHYTYLNSLKNKTDSSDYHFINYYLINKNERKMLEYYSVKNEVINNNHPFINKASLHFLTGKKEYKEKWFTSMEISDSLFNEIKLVYLASENPSCYNSDLFDESIQFKKHKKMYAKKPVLGGIYSMLLPGSGKWYAGKPKSFLMVFFLNASYSLTSYESINRLGIKNPYSIANLSIAGLFYLANIYGGYKATQDAKKEYKHQFLLNAQNYYNFNYSFY